MLAVAILFLTTQPALASGMQARGSIRANSNVSEINEVVLEQNQKHTLMLQLVDYENGDAAVITIENNAVINETYIDRSERKIIRTDYGDKATTSVSRYEEVKYDISPMLLAATYQRVGTISYGILNGTGSTITKTETAVVSNYETINKSAQYNIRGTYKDQAALIASLCGLLAAPAGVISPIAGYILSGLGFAAGAVNIIVQDYYVDCVRYSSNWMFKDSKDSSNVDYYSGQMYVVNYQGNTTRPTVGDYYPLSAFTRNDQALAEGICQRLWGYPSFRVTGWTYG